MSVQYLSSRRPPHQTAGVGQIHFPFQLFNRLRVFNELKIHFKFHRDPDMLSRVRSALVLFISDFDVASDEGCAVFIRYQGSVLLNLIPLALMSVTVAVYDTSSLIR